MQVQYSQRNLPANSQRKYIQSTHIPQGYSGEHELSPSFPIELKGIQLLSLSPSGVMSCNACATKQQSAGQAPDLCSTVNGMMHAELQALTAVIIAQVVLHQTSQQKGFLLAWKLCRRCMSNSQAKTGPVQFWQVVKVISVSLPSCVKEDGGEQGDKQHRSEKHVSKRAVNCMLTVLLHLCSSYFLCSQVLQICISAQRSTEDGGFDCPTGDCMFGGCRHSKTGNKQKSTA